MGRPSTPILSVDKIATAALRLVDAGHDLRMGDVAAALGVRPSSLYNHVSGKAELVEAVRALIFRDVVRDVAADAEAARPADRLRALLRLYRASFARHPRVIPLLTAQTVSAPNVMAMYDELTAVLESCGVPDDRLLDVVTVLDSFVIGSALDVAAPDDVWDSSSASTESLRRAIDTAPRGRERADRAFEVGIELLVGGIAASTHRPADWSP